MGKKKAAVHIGGTAPVAWTERGVYAGPCNYINMGARGGGYAYEILNIPPRHWKDNIPVGVMDFRIVGTQDEVLAWLEAHRRYELRCFRQFGELSDEEANEEIFLNLSEMLRGGSPIPGLDDRMHAAAVAFLRKNPRYLERAIAHDLDGLEDILEEEFPDFTGGDGETDSDTDDADDRATRRANRRKGKSRSTRRRGKKRSGDRRKRASKVRRRVRDASASSSASSSSSSSSSAASSSASASSSDGDIARVRRATPKHHKVTMTWGQLAESNGGRIYQKEVATRIWSICGGMLALANDTADPKLVNVFMQKAMSGFGHASTAVGMKAKGAQTKFHVTFSTRGRPIGQLTKIEQLSDGTNIGYAHQVISQQIAMEPANQAKGFIKRGWQKAKDFF